jgi:hypothetical protein
MRTTLIVLLILSLSAFGAQPATAAPAKSTTITFQDATATMTESVPCISSTPILITITYNGVIHFTTLKNGTTHFTGTMTGTFTFDTATIDYTGHFAVWFGGNTNARNAFECFNLNIQATGTDGSVVSAAAVGHFNTTAGESGPKFFFQMTCNGDVTRAP